MQVNANDIFWHFFLLFLSYFRFKKYQSFTFTMNEFSVWCGYHWCVCVCVRVASGMHRWDIVFKFNFLIVESMEKKNIIKS